MHTLRATCGTTGAHSTRLTRYATSPASRPSGLRCLLKPAQAVRLGAKPLRKHESPARNKAAQVVHASSAASEGSPDSGEAKRGITTAYAALSIVLGAVSAAKVFLTQQYAENVFSALLLSGQEQLMVKSAGAGIAVTATALWCLADASSNRRLGSDTYKRLNLGMFLSAALTLWLTKTYSHVFLPRACTAIMVVAGLKAVTTAFVHVSLTGLSPGPVVEGVVHSMRRLLENENIISTGYSVVCAAFAALGIERLVNGVQAAIVANTDLAQFLVGSISIAYLVCSVVAFALKDGADRKRLGGSTFKRLNAALGAFGVTGAALLVWGAKQDLLLVNTPFYLRVATFALTALVTLTTLGAVESDN